MFNPRRILATALVAIGMTSASPAFAEPILLDADSVGESYTITFDGFVDNGPSIGGLSGLLDLTLTSVLNGIYNFDYSVTNTGSTSDSVGSRLSGFAFNTDPDISSASSTGDFDNAITGGNYPNGIGTVDVCFTGSRSRACAGGGSGGVFDGATGTGTLALEFASAPTTLTLDDFFVRYQSVTGVNGVGSASGRQTSTTSSSSGVDVPAPGMVLIVAAALIGLLGRRRKLPVRKPTMAVA